MAKDLTSKLYDDVTRYELGNVASRLVMQKDIPNAKGALKKLAADLGRGDEYSGFVDTVLGDERAIKNASLLYGSKFNTAIGGINIGELYNLRYNKILQAYFDDADRPTVEGLIKEFSGETYGEIIGKITAANEILESRTKNFSDDQKREAKKTLDKYQYIGAALDLLERARFEEFRPEAAQESLKIDAKEFSKSLRER